MGPPSVQPPLPSGVAQSHGSILAPIATIPFRVESGLAFVDITINGFPVTVVMDTGAPVIALDPALVSSAHIHVLRETGQGDIGRGRVDSLRIGSLVVRDQEVRLRPFGAINDSTSGRPSVLGVIGTAFFRRFVTEFDFPSHTVSLHDPATFTYAGPGIPVSITFRQDLPQVRALIARNGKEPVAARLIIDLGSANTPVALTSAFANQAGLIASSGPSIEVAGVTSLYGTGVGRIQRVPSVSLGDLTIVRPIVNISDALGAAIPPSLADGTIGMPVLRRTTMILDYQRSRIIFEKNSEFDTPYEFTNVSGLQLERVRGAIRVRNVIAGSPAAESKFRIGDEIVTVDDKPVPESGSLNIPELREPGTMHRLLVRRAGQTFVMTISLRRLI